MCDCFYCTNLFPGEVQIWILCKRLHIKFWNVIFYDVADTSDYLLLKHANKMQSQTNIYLIFAYKFYNVKNIFTKYFYYRIHFEIFPNFNINPKSSRYNNVREHRTMKHISQEIFNFLLGEFQIGVSFLFITFIWVDKNNFRKIYSGNSKHLFNVRCVM